MGMEGEWGNVGGREEELRNSCGLGERAEKWRLKRLLLQLHAGLRGERATNG